MGTPGQLSFNWPSHSPALSIAQSKDKGGKQRNMLFISDMGLFFSSYVEIGSFEKAAIVLRY